jgi:hypothetical protein
MSTTPSRRVRARYASAQAAKTEGSCSSPCCRQLRQLSPPAPQAWTCDHASDASAAAPRRSASVTPESSMTRCHSAIACAALNSVRGSAPVSCARIVSQSAASHPAYGRIAGVGHARCPLAASAASNSACSRRARRRLGVTAIAPSARADRRAFIARHGIRAGAADYRAAGVARDGATQTNSSRLPAYLENNPRATRRAKGRPGFQSSPTTAAKAEIPAGCAIRYPPRWRPSVLGR